MSDHIATGDIPFGDPGRGVFAFRAGDKVPADLVKSNKWEEYVASPSSKAGQEALATASGEAPATTSTTSTKGGNA